MSMTRLGLISAALLSGSVLAAPAFAQNGQQDLGQALWNAARDGQVDRVERLTRDAAASEDPMLAEIATAYLDALDSREALRDEQRTESWKRIKEILAEDFRPVQLSEGLAQLARLTEITPDRGSVLNRAEAGRLIRAAERAARDADERGDWLLANELLFRLDSIFDIERTYAAQLRVMSQRLTMLQMYAPERLWELRNARRLAEDLSPLPAYNPLGDDYRTKLDGIRIRPTIEGIRNAATQQVDRQTGALRDSLLSGLAAMESMANMDALHDAFPSLAEADQRRALLDWVAEERERLNGLGRVNVGEVDRTVDGLLRVTRNMLPQDVALHEFGAGALAIYDDYSGIFWPDDVRRFQRTTQGNFIGVGISVQLDELQNIKVVTPLEGTPAQRSGIRSGDIIKFVDGQSTAGLGLSQAVDIITGPANSRVVLGVERVKAGQEKKENPETEVVNIEITRQRIVVKTVNGWERSGEDGWNWFLDADRGIGYIRMTQFTGTTSDEFDAAIREMRRKGLRGLVLDLRFNPGGLLNQAVEIADRFLPRGAEIVSTQDADGRIRERNNSPREASVGNIPVVMLINNGAASASEIVAGAVQDHAQMGNVDAILIGERSFGKGSVQVVSPLRGSANQMALKLTTQYYRLPSGRLIHRKPGATQWGIDPNYTVEMLPSQETAALLLRRDADILRSADEIVADRPNPGDLVTKGVDPQLQAALLLLRARTADASLLAGAPADASRR
jgi:carboxyl-terminal processing protease